MIGVHDSFQRFWTVTIMTNTMQGTLASLDNAKNVERAEVWTIG